MLFGFSSVTLSGLVRFDLYFRRSIFRTVSLVPFERKPKTHEFSTGQKFVSIYYILTESEVITGKSQPEALMC